MLPSTFVFEDQVCYHFEMPDEVVGDAFIINAWYAYFLAVVCSMAIERLFDV